MTWDTLSTAESDMGGISAWLGSESGCVLWRAITQSSDSVSRSLTSCSHSELGPSYNVPLVESVGDCFEC